MFKDIVSRLVHEVCDNLDTANLFSVFQWMNHNNKFTHSPTRVFLDTHSFNKRFLNVKIHHWSLQTGVLEVTYHVYCLLEFFGVSCSYHVTGRLTPVSKLIPRKKTRHTVRRKWNMRTNWLTFLSPLRLDKCYSGTALMRKRIFVLEMAIFKQENKWTCYLPVALLLYYQYSVCLLQPSDYSFLTSIDFFSTSILRSAEI